MAKLAKKPRGAGRPNRLNKLEDTLTDAILSGSEKLVAAYPTAVSYLIKLLEDDKATPASRLQAAKLIKEACEGTLEDMLDQSTSAPSPDDEDSDQPVLNLVSTR